MLESQEAFERLVQERLRQAVRLALISVLEEEDTVFIKERGVSDGNKAMLGVIAARFSRVVVFRLAPAEDHDRE